MKITFYLVSQSNIAPRVYDLIKLELRSHLEVYLSVMFMTTEPETESRPSPS